MRYSIYRIVRHLRRPAGSAGARAGGRGIIAAAGLLLLLLIVLPARAGAQQQVYSAERVKAAFLYHFATYVNWPSTAEISRTFTIAVLGADEVAAELEDFLPGHTIQGRPMQVHRLQSLADLAGDEVLYIGANEDEELREHLAAVASRPLLVVTDTPDGLRDGAMINFRIVDDRVRFEISLRAARDAGLEMSSRLLSAAMSVESAGAIIDFDNTVVATDRKNRVVR